MPYISYSGQNALYAKMHPVNSSGQILLNTEYVESNPTSSKSHAGAQVDVEYRAYYVCSVNLYHLSAAKMEDGQADIEIGHRLVLSLYEDDVFKGMTEVEERDLARYKYTLVTRPLQIRKDRGQIELVLHSSRIFRDGHESKATYKFSIQYCVARLPRLKKREDRGKGSICLSKLDSSALFIYNYAREGEAISARRRVGEEIAIPEGNNRSFCDKRRRDWRIEEGNSERSPSSRRRRCEETDVQRERRKILVEGERSLDKELIPIPANLPVILQGNDSIPKKITPRQDQAVIENNLELRRENPELVNSNVPDTTITGKQAEIEMSRTQDQPQDGSVSGVFGQAGAIDPVETSLNDQNPGAEDDMMDNSAKALSSSVSLEQMQRVKCSELQMELERIEAEEEEAKRRFIVTQLQKTRTSVELIKAKTDLEGTLMRMKQGELHRMQRILAEMVDASEHTSSRSQSDGDGFETLEVRMREK